MQDEPEARVSDSELDFDEDLTYTRGGQLFTGVAYEDVPGRGLSEISYRNGLQEGVARDSYPSGRLKGESHYKENILHGWLREFDEDSNVLLESLYEYGILVSSIKRDATGTIVERFELDPDDPTFDLLKRYREERKWHT